MRATAPDRSHLSRGYAIALAAAAILSTTAIFIRHLTQTYHIPALVLAFLLLGGDRLTGRALLAGAGRVAILAAGFLMLFLLLNPLYLCHPWDTARAVFAERNSFSVEQVSALTSAAPGQVLNTPGIRALGMIYEPFFAPLAFWDIPNYVAATAGTQQAYLSSPLQVLSNGGLFNALWFLICGFGLIVGVRRIWVPRDRMNLIALWLWILGVMAGIALEVPILWQRYYLPLIPAFAIFAGIAVSEMMKLVRRALEIKPQNG